MVQWYHNTMVASSRRCPGRNDERAVRMALQPARAALTASTDHVLPGTAVDYGASGTIKRPHTVARPAPSG
jgi:hypothetical protein